MRNAWRRSRGAGLSSHDGPKTPAASPPEGSAPGLGRPGAGAVDAAVRTLRDPATIRARCAAITAHVADGRSAHFALDRTKLGAVADRIATLTRTRFPDLKIPYHSRWRHFEAGGIDRKAELDAKLAGRSAIATARARIDLALVSVLLDAGAGPDWRYREAESGQSFGRSEGLGVASFRAFLAGRFSSDPGDPCRVDAAALLKLDAAALADIFQVRADNPLVGLDGRAALMNRLGEALRAQPQTFTSIGQPGHLFDALTHHPHAPRLHHHHPQPAPLHHHVRRLSHPRRAAGVPSAASGRAGWSSTVFRWVMRGRTRPRAARAPAPAGCLSTSSASG